MRWPRPRLSVRMMLVAVALSGLTLGWVVVPAWERHEAVGAITGSGGWLLYDWQSLDPRIKATPPRDPLGLRSLLGPDALDTPVLAAIGPGGLDDRRLARVAKLDRLHTLALALGGPNDPTPGGMAAIRGLRHLRQFSVAGGDSSGFLPHLGGLPELRGLDWKPAITTEADLEAISRLTRLETLGLDGRDLTEAGLMQLARLPGLRSLDIHGFTPRIDWQARRRFLKAMPGLRFFGLDGRLIVNTPTPRPE